MAKSARQANRRDPDRTRRLSVIFGRGLDAEAALRRRKQHNIDMILHAIRA